MTAEIGVMNRIGVALAADSAVTVDGHEGKIYTSSDKLFHMAVAAPVGAMAYGTASLVEIPWETVIKTYRKQLGNKTFNTIEGYALDIIQFLRRRRDMFSRQLQRSKEETLVGICFLKICNEIYKKLEEKEKTKSELSDEEIKKTAGEVVKDNLDFVRNWEIPSGLPKNIRQTLRKELRGTLRSVKQKSFKKLPMTQNTSRNLTTLGLEVLTRCWLGSYESGIVIAGFGENEYTPGLVEIKIDGIVEGRLKYSVKDARKIGEKTNSWIIPFAQKEMVQAFMEGIDPDIKNIIYDSTASLFFGVVNTIIDKVKKSDKKFGKRLEKEVNVAIIKLLEELFKKWDNKRRTLHWGPITQIVSSLPKDELAAMAESLVNLTKFRRKVTPERETVAGPIDVAVITKGDGFVWVKRKHYFDPKLNPRTMGRYLKEAVYNGKA